MEKYQITDWRFSHDNSEHNWQKDLDVQKWQKIEVPHDWSVAEPFNISNSSGTAYLNGGIGWYRTTVDLTTLPFSTKNHNIILHFDGAYKNAEVWANGYHLGNRPSGYSEFEFDLTEILQYQQDNQLVIAVKLTHTDLADSRWYNGSGITRPVYLYCQPKVYIPTNGTFFQTTAIKDGKAYVSITHTIKNTTTGKQTVEIQDALTFQGTEATTLTKQIELDKGQERIVTLTAELKQANIWSVDQPNLYLLTTKICNSYFTTTYQIEVGIRTFHFSADHGFSLNGQSMKIKGVCLHEDAGCLGTAVPKEVWLRRLLKLKKMGANAIRMSHNPHTPILYQLCDQLGFLVFDEAFDEWENPKNKWWQGHNVYPPKFEGYSHVFTEWAKEDLINLIKRNRNHPSIIAWSIGNEIDYPNDPYANKLFNEMTGNNDSNKPEQERIYNAFRPDTRRLTTIAKKLAKIVKETDSTRPVTLAAAFPELSAQTGLLDPLDVVGYNYKEFLYQQDHQKFPTKPFIGSENSHSFDAWKAVTDNEFVAGQFLWTGIDYLGEAAGWPIHGSGAGLLTTAGFEKSNYFLRQSWWSEQPVLSIMTAPVANSNKDLTDEWLSVSPKWDYQTNEQVIIRIYTNCSDLIIKLGSNTIATDKVKYQHGYYQLVIPYAATDLTVTGKFKQKDLVATLTPTGAPVSLDAQVWETTHIMNSHSDNSKVVQVELSLLDQNNHQTQASNLINVVVEHGKLLGIENGDLADNTAYSAPYRRAYEGKLIAYIQPSTKETTVTFKTANFADKTIKIKNH